MFLPEGLPLLPLSRGLKTQKRSPPMEIILWNAILNLTIKVHAQEYVEHNRGGQINRRHYNVALFRYRGASLARRNLIAAPIIGGGDDRDAIQRLVERKATQLETKGYERV